MGDGRTDRPDLQARPGPGHHTLPFGPPRAYFPPPVRVQEKEGAAALAYAKLLAEAAPDDPEAQALLQQLRRDQPAGAG